MSKEFINQEDGIQDNKVQGGYGPKSKGKKPRSRRDRPCAKLEDKVTNDVRYWNKVEGYNNVTKLQWPLIIGRRFLPNQVLPASYYPSMKRVNDMRIPQIMTIDLVTGPGWASTTQDGVNRALSTTMSNIRSSLSTSNIGFAPADLGIFMTSTYNIGCVIGYLKKMIAARNRWNPRNYAYPRGFYKAHGFDWDVETESINQTLARFNAIIDQFNNMSLLDLSELFDRQFTLFHNVYLDEDSDYGQMYSFKPVNFYLYDDKQSKAIYKQPNWRTFSDVLNDLEAMVNAWLLSDDFYQINGTLHRAFKDHPRLTIDHATVEDIITPTTDRDILMQVMNMTITPIDYSSAVEFVANDITQDKSNPTYIQWKPRTNPTIDATHPVVDNHYLMRAFEDELTQDDNMEMTRLLNMKDVSSEFVESAVTYYYYTNCGAELVQAVDLWYYDPALEDVVNVGNLKSNYINTASLTFPTAASITNFRYIPMLMMYSVKDQNLEFSGLLGDVYNYMILSNKDWQALNAVAYQSVWLPKD